MSTIKWGLFPGGAAFALALISSLLFGGTSFTVALLRALVFAAVFFGMGIGIRALIKTFLPELLGSSSQSNVTDHVFSPASTAVPAAGSQVNITLDDPGADAALPEQDNGSADDPAGSSADGLANDVGDFADLVSPAGLPAAKAPAHKDIDQNPVNSYTEETGEFSPALDDAKDEGSGEFSLDFGAFVAGAEELDDGGSFMDSFSPFSDEDTALPGEVAPPERKPAGNKTEKLEGDFNAKEIAAGLRTVLDKDKKG